MTALAQHLGLEPSQVVEEVAFGGYGSVAGNWVYCLELMMEDYPDVYSSKLDLEMAILKAKKEAKVAASNYK